MLRRREVSSEELTRATLDRIDRHDPRLRAFVTSDPEGAMYAARQADRRRRERPGSLGVLHGLPMSLKDAFATAGIRTTAGRPDLAQHVPSRDAVVAARLRAAGAILVGKTNLPTGVSGQETANVVAGRTVNPWDPDRSPGGSSGGAAAALAAGLVPLEVGSDSGGSIRQPCHATGVYGHVATHGLVPQRGHLPSVNVDDVGAVLDLFSIGPMARHPSNLALALPVLVGADPLGPAAWSVDLPASSVRVDDLHGVRVSIVSSHPSCPTSADVRGALERAARELEAAGAEVRDDLPGVDLGEAMDLGFRLWAAANGSDDDGKGGLDDHLSRARADAIAVDHAGWLELDERRRQIARRWNALFEEVDVALLPISPVTAVPHDPDLAHLHEVGHRLERRIDVDGVPRPYLDQVLWNVAVGMGGLPATAVPLGRCASGIPTGAQVVSAPHRDLTTIAFAEALGAVLGGFDAPPGWA